MAGQVQNMINSNGNPMDLYRQITKDKTPEQMQQFYAFTKKFGIPDEIINQVQNNGNNTN